MYDNQQYYWVVLCRNHWFHRRRNLFVGHTIPLGETDAYALPPNVGDPFSVRCDECGKDYHYRPKDLLRAEIEPRSDFAAHQLFR